MAKGLIWILEDDEGCRFVYDAVLGKDYRLVHFTGLEKFAAALRSKDIVQPELVITDLILDDGSFLDYLQEHEKVFPSNTPFIVISNIDEMDALRACFKRGALDYLTKPFRKGELIVKVEKAFEKNRKLAASSFRSVRVDTTDVMNLTVKQKQMLELFLSQETRIITREQILDTIWGGVSVHPKTVDVHLYNLRRKLEEYGYAVRSEGVGRWALISRLK